PDSAKMMKQMGYADSEKIPYVAIIGESEIEEGVINLKDMVSGTQEKLTAEDLIEKLKD
ncbi:MAG: histidine--tRNA ligase, partial [Muribaculaceae bacterium]|nr:histidine--tRNA ligase [Muribaculaceae bacterium]